MTAIALLWRLDGADAAPHADRMLMALRPYGVHHRACWQEGPIALGRVLHRTTPEDVFDRQPIHVAGSECVIVADIRLDNRDDLIPALGLTPADAAVMADSDLLAKSWECWGEDCVPRLVGDFAFMVWDKRRQQIFCARDAMGRRPLFYHRAGNFVAIATMPKGLLALPEIPKELDEAMLGAFLAGLPSVGTANPLAQRSFYRGVARIPPGHCLTITREHDVLRRHWSATEVSPVRYARDQDYVDRARELFDQAVAASLRSTGAIGSHISAGLDSSSVTVTAARLLGLRGGQLTAFTAVPRPEERPPVRAGFLGDEGPLAAEALLPFANVEHIRVPYPLLSPMEPVARNLYAFDEPMRNPCNQAWLEEIGLRAQDRQIAVMLHAPVGNATLSYTGSERIHQLFRTGQLATWIAELRLSTANQPDLGLRIKRMIELSLSPRLQQDVQRFLGKWWTRPDIRSPLSKEAITQGGLDERISRRSRSWSNARLQQGLRARMFAFADPGVEVAGTLARHGFELRDPTGDRRVVEFCLGIPLDQFQRRGQEKLLVRRLMRGALPTAMLDSTSCGLQGIGWLRNMHFGQAEIRQEIRAMRASALGSRLLDLDSLENLANRIPDGSPTDMVEIASFRHKLLRGAAAAYFIRYVEGGNA